MKPNHPAAFTIFSKMTEKSELESDEIKSVNKFVERFVFAKAFQGFHMTSETQLNQNLQADLYKVVLASQALTELYELLNDLGYTDLDIDEVTCQNEAIFATLSANEKFNRFLRANAPSDSNAIKTIEKCINQNTFDVICYAKAIEEVFSLHKTNSRYLCLFNLIDQLMIKQLGEFVLSCCELDFAKFTTWLSESACGNQNFSMQP